MSSSWTSLPLLSGGGNLAAKRFVQGTFAALCLLALSSCGPVFGGKDSPSSTAASTASATAAPGTPVQTSVAPPGMGARALEPGQSGAPHLPDGMPALQPARGVNLETLFSEDIKDPVDRVKRVENAVVEIRRDFDSVLPAIVRLTAVEQDMQELLTQLDSLLRSEPPVASAPVTADPLPAASSIDAASAAPANITPPAAQAAVPAQTPVATPPATPPPAAATSGTRVTALRVGEHPGKTRLVFDMTGASSYRYDLDNAENLLVLELAGAGWAAAATQNFAKSPLLQSYSTQAMDGGGTRVILQLKRAAGVAYEAALKPEGGNGNRLVIDLK